MQSKKCLICDLISFADATVCKQCGTNFTEFNSPKKTNLFTCPDCQNLCSKTAPNCPSCGKVFNPTPVYITQPPKKTTPFTWFVLVVILAVPILCCLSTSNKTTSTSSEYATAATPINPPKNSKDPKDYNNPAGRKIFINGFKQMAIENGSSEVIFDTEGIENKILSIQSRLIERNDCSKFVSDWSKMMANVGFNKVVCRNSNSREQWSYVLTS